MVPDGAFETHRKRWGTSPQARQILRCPQNDMPADFFNNHVMGW
jgi:hypothetical protein